MKFREPFLLQEQPFDDTEDRVEIASMAKHGRLPLSESVSVIVGHHLGKAEAIRRLKDGLARTHGQLGSVITMDQESWEGDTLRFSMRAFGHAAAGSIEVLEDALRIEVSLPWLLAKAVNRLLPVLRKQATLLLEKK